MDKSHIIAEIRRTAAANGGAVLGWRRFEQETGIGYYDWYGQYWARWGDAVREAGFEPNRLTAAYDDDVLIQALIKLTRQLGRVPSNADVVLARKNDPDFPAEKTVRRLGPKSSRAKCVVKFCDDNPGNEDVGALWRASLSSRKSEDVANVSIAPVTSGFVYLVKHGSRNEYKIGRTNNTLRREGEISLELPEKLTPVHYIQTDDPAGIENYWHTRFANKRKNGEWFALTASDVKAFKRWKRIF